MPLHIPPRLAPRLINADIQKHEPTGIDWHVCMPVCVCVCVCVCETQRETDGGEMSEMDVNKES